MSSQGDGAKHHLGLHHHSFHRDLKPIVPFREKSNACPGDLSEEKLSSGEKVCESLDKEEEVMVLPSMVDSRSINWLTLTSRV